MGPTSGESVPVPVLIFCCGRREEYRTDSAGLGTSGSSALVAQVSLNDTPQGSAAHNGTI